MEGPVLLQALTWAQMLWETAYTLLLPSQAQEVTWPHLPGALTLLANPGTTSGLSPTVGTEKGLWNSSRHQRSWARAPSPSHGPFGAGAASKLNLCLSREKASPEPISI